MRLKNQRIFFMSAVLLWAGFIFYMSSRTADNSSAMSEGFTKTVMSVFPQFNQLDESAKLQTILNLQFIVRKTAHTFIYLVLGGLAASLSFCYPARASILFSRAAAGCLLYAVSDEFHQLFVPGRSCEARDVLIDFCGSLAGIGLAFFIRHLLAKRGLRHISAP